MPSVEIDVEVTVTCEGCGKKVDAQVSLDRGEIRVVSSICTFCQKSHCDMATNAGYDDGYHDAKAEYSILNPVRDLCDAADHVAGGAP